MTKPLGTCLWSHVLMWTIAHESEALISSLQDDAKKSSFLQCYLAVLKDEKAMSQLTFKGCRLSTTRTQRFKKTDVRIVGLHIMTTQVSCVAPLLAPRHFLQFDNRHVKKEIAKEEKRKEIWFEEDAQATERKMQKREDEWLQEIYKKKKVQRNV